MLTLTVFGRTKCLDSSGNDRMPHGQKARALFLLLAVSPDLSRTRSWLQSKLWSDRSTKQASGSLRAALVEVRQALGPHRDNLLSNRNSVAFKPGSIKLDYRRPEEAMLTWEMEAFEGIDARDPEFENLLRDLRSEIGNRSETDVGKIDQGSGWDQTSLHVVRIETRPTEDRVAEAAMMVLVQQIRTAIQQFGDFIVLVGDNSNHLCIGEVTPIHVLEIFGIEILGGVFLACSLRVPPSNDQVWSITSQLDPLPSNFIECINISKLARDAVEQIARSSARKECAASSAGAAASLEMEALELLFSLRKADMHRADELLRLAFEMSPRGQYLAWRGFLRNLAEYQHRNLTFLEDDCSSVQLASQAIRHSPDNSVVQAVCSQLDYIHQDDLQSSLKMAEQACELNPSNPLAWAVFSNTLTVVGYGEQSYDAAARATYLTRSTTFHYFYEHFACMSAAALGDYERSLNHARVALRYRPDFVSSRRYELALALGLGDERAAQSSEQEMQKFEPNFKRSDMLESTYPVTTLRRLPLMDAVAKD